MENLYACCSCDLQASEGLKNKVDKKQAFAVTVLP